MSSSESKLRELVIENEKSFEKGREKGRIEVINELNECSPCEVKSGVRDKIREIQGYKDLERLKEKVREKDEKFNELSDSVNSVFIEKLQDLRKEFSVGNSKINKAKQKVVRDLREGVKEVLCDE